MSTGHVTDLVKWVRKTGCAVYEATSIPNMMLWSVCLHLISVTGRQFGIMAIAILIFGARKDHVSTTGWSWGGSILLCLHSDWLRLRPRGHTSVVTCQSPGSHALKNTLLYHLLYPKWDHNSQNETRLKTRVGDHQLVRKLFNEVKKIIKWEVGSFFFFSKLTCNGAFCNQWSCLLLVIKKNAEGTFA